MKQPRIITGKFKGSKLEVPHVSRPFTDRLKKTVFDILGDRLFGAKVADLFAGSGNIGIEALSRGSEKVDFVDSDKKAISSITRNLNKIGASKESYSIFNMYVHTFANKAPSGDYDIIFLDPPFASASMLRLGKLVKICHKDTLIVLKLPIHEKEIAILGNKFEILYNEKYGKNKLFFLKINLQ